MKITYIGHSCFVIENNAGGKIATDPYKPGSVPGLSAPDIEAHEVLCSHGHSDHNDFDAVRTPEEPWDGDFKIKTIKTWAISDVSSRILRSMSLKAVMSSLSPSEVSIRSTQGMHLRCCLISSRAP